MAKKGDTLRTFNISVIGLSGSERDKGQYGVGKSCLCNRFVHQVADKYHSEHISVLSQSDFAGRVINNDHFLYWGDVTKTMEGNNLTFHVIEQTEFIDDVSFQPFKTGHTEPYVKRSTTVKVQSAEKLMYICKDQLGMETDSSYEQKVVPEGRLGIDGFICCFDVSQVPQRPSEKQFDFVTSLLLAAQKTKKPVVLVSTKQDEADDQLLRELERLLTRREFKGTIPLVETSAHENVNIEAAFMLLASLIDRSRPRFKIHSFVEAARMRREICQVATDAYRQLLRSNISDPRMTWTSARRKLQQEQDFAHYTEQFGTEQARREFRRHIKHLREEQIRLREHYYLQQLPRLLRHYLPNVEDVAERSWPSVQRLIQSHPDFSSHFIQVCQAGESWKQTEDFLDDKEESRIPFDLLTSPEAEDCFRSYLHELRNQQRKKQLQLDFKKVLEENVQVSVGRPLSETYVFLLGKECYSDLDDKEKAAIYEEHQQQLKVKARRDFHELLWEHSELFWKMSTIQRLTRDDLLSISTALQNDERYRKLSRAEEERKVMILNHLGFLQCPSRDRCYYREACIDNQLMELLASKAENFSIGRCDHVSEDCAEDCNINLVLLGKDGLATALNRDIRAFCVDDEYSYAERVYSLDYRPIDGDVSREQNALSTASFRPHGCICVYDNEDSLQYIKKSLEQWLVWQGDRDQWLAHGMPFVLVQSCQPHTSLKQYSLLRDLGMQLAQRLHTHFVEATSVEEWKQLEDSGDGENMELRLFSNTAIDMALQSVIGHSKSSQWPLLPQPQPDIRICMCMMCGDPFTLDLPLGPLMACEGVTFSAATPCSLTLQAHLESQRRTVEIELSSYHGRPMTHRVVRHGYILVYSAQRQASLATLRAFALLLPAVPKLIVAVADSGGAAHLFFHSEASQILIRNGNQLADDLGALFITTSANFTQQTAAYLPFLREVMELREQSEAACMVPVDEPCPPAYDDEHHTYMDHRPPAPLPYYDTYNSTKSNSSNSHSTDSEPVYDQPNLYQSHYSDSEHDRGSSVSPAASEDIYAEVHPEDCSRSTLDHTGRDLYKGLTEVTPGEVHRKGQCDSVFNDKHGHPTAYHYTTEGVGLTGSQHMQAPLAVPEPIEIADYSLVKDAVENSDVYRDYASVDDALPPGQLQRIRSTKSPNRTAFDVCSNSGSDGSEGTGDEVANFHHDRQRLSLRTHKFKSRMKQQASFHVNPAVTDDDVPANPKGVDEGLYDAVRLFQTLPVRMQNTVPANVEEGELDLNDSGHWSSKIPGFKTLRDPEKLRKKEERRRLKEEKQKQKEKKKESKAVGAQSGCSLEDFTTSATLPLIPTLVEKCINFIESEGMSTEGIYRIPGNRAQGELFLSRFTEDPNVDILSLDVPVSAIATVLKSFFNDLTEPLVPRFLHAELMEAAGVPDKSSRLLMLRGVIKKLPEQNLEILKFLICHLHKVSEHHRDNNMDTRNLARCWWPTIMRMEFPSYEAMLQYSAYPEDIVLTLIDQYNFFFFGGNEV